MWRELLVRLLLIALAIPIGSAETPSSSTLLPIEVVGEDGTTISRTLTLGAAQSESVRSLWLQVHGLRYPQQASVQVNARPWIPLNNDTVTVAAPGGKFGGIGGGFATLVLTLPYRTVLSSLALTPSASGLIGLTDSPVAIASLPGIS